MLISDNRQIGNKLYALRKATGMNQAQVAELADLSDRAYADIERGNVTMRIDTMLKLCHVFHITPDVLFVADTEPSVTKESVMEILAQCDDTQLIKAAKIIEILISGSYPTR